MENCKAHRPFLVLSFKYSTKQSSVDTFMHLYHLYFNIFLLQNKVTIRKIFKTFYYKGWLRGCINIW